MTGNHLLSNRNFYNQLIAHVVGKAYAKVRRIKITQLLIEIDQLIHFSRHFTHLHSGDPAKDREALFASLLAEATNLGLTRMAGATPGMTRTRLSWVSDWYVRDDCFTRALAEIVNYHHRLPCLANWGDGTISSRRVCGEEHQEMVARSGDSALSRKARSAHHR